MERKLKFIVEGQIIKPDPECDFENLVPGTEDYLTAEFNFSDDWIGYKKAVAFYSIMGKEYEPQLLKNNKSCVIPPEALKRRAFKIMLVGRKGETKKTTNKLEIKQNGGAT